MPKRYRVTYHLKPYEATAYGGKKVTSKPESHTTAWMAEPSYNKWKANHPTSHYVIERTETQNVEGKGKDSGNQGFHMMR
jgi:hypothetical protein